MKIYTKTGDQGKTGLIGGTRVSKSDLRLEAYGTVDELNAHIGLLCAEGVSGDQAGLLEIIQNDLFLLGSWLATDQTIADASKFLPDESHISDLETAMDKMNEILPELKSFILPGGCKAASQAHICRTVSRRAERRIIAFSLEYNTDNLILKFINRLSDYFFVLSRHLNHLEGIEEISWKL